MKKNILIALGVLLCFVSCQNKEMPGQDLQPGQGDTALSDATVFWGVVGQLIDYREMTPEYEGKTFKAIVGSADGGDESVRVVSVNSLSAAVSRFNELTDAGVTESTATKTWRHAAVGSLTWNLTTDNTSWATVDVDIQAVPGLRKIIYRSAEQGNVNGDVGDGGSAYYRFGDVIQRRRSSDGVYEHWICVRPSFGPEGKGKSHWVSVSPLPEENIWPYNSTKETQRGKPWKASNDMFYGLPDGIRSELEWHQDLAELLFAILYPSVWFTNVTNYSREALVLGYPTGLPIFNDFHSGRIRFHNEAFWKNVQQQWKDRNLVELIFGVSYDEMRNALNPANPDARGLHLLYYGYDWNTKTSNWPKLFQAHYTHGESNEKLNMHKQTTGKVSHQVVVPRNKELGPNNFPLDVYNLTSASPYLVEPRFFGDNHPRWIVRFATGEELSDTHNYDPQLPIPGFHTTTSEIYRYYRDVYPDKFLTDPPEITMEDGTSGYKGKAHYRWGDVYKDEDGVKWVVINMAGTYADEGYSERAPYSELISFEPRGFKLFTPQFSDVPSKVTNLPSLDIAIRVYAYLYLLFNQGIDKNTDVKLQEDVIFGKTIWNMIQHLDVDVRKMMQVIIAQNGNERDPSYACCIAYDGQGTEQRLLRCILNIQNEMNDPKFYLWTRYPEDPDTQTTFVQDFSDFTIKLQDIANPDMVTAFAPDSYAVQPLSKSTLPSSDEVTPRNIRAQADPRAKDVRNYFYDRTTFDQLAYPGSMWNEPVLLFRYTRVMDRGDKDFSERTVDGHKLTLVAQREWINVLRPEEVEEFYETVQTYALHLWSSVEGGVFLNGQPYSVKRWNEIKDTEINSK